MNLIPVGTEVRVRSDSPYYPQNFVDKHLLSGTLQGIVINNDHQSAGDKRYIYRVEWFLKGHSYDKNNYRPLDLEAIHNIGMVHKMNQEDAL